MSDYVALRRLAEERGLRLLKHPSGSRKMGALKVKDRDGNMVCWPSPPDVVERWLRDGHQSGIKESASEDNSEQERVPEDA